MEFKSEEAERRSSAEGSAAEQGHRGTWEMTWEFSYRSMESSSEHICM